MHSLANSNRKFTHHGKSRPTGGRVGRKVGGGEGGGEDLVLACACDTCHLTNQVTCAMVMYGRSDQTRAPKMARGSYGLVSLRVSW